MSSRARDGARPGLFRWANRKLAAHAALPRSPGVEPPAESSGEGTDPR